MREKLVKILAKGSFDSADLNVLAENQSYLTQEEKVRLGFAPAVAQAPVVVEKESSPEVVAPVVTESKSVTRRRAVSKKKV